MGGYSKGFKTAKETIRKWQFCFVRTLEFQSPLFVYLQYSETMKENGSFEFQSPLFFLYLYSLYSEHKAKHSKVIENGENGDMLKR